MAGFLSAFEVLDDGVSDLDSVSGAGSSPGTDALAWVGQRGIHLASWNEQTEALERQVLDLGNFHGSQVRTGDLDGDGRSEILVLEEAGQSIHVYAKHSGAWQALGTTDFPNRRILDFDLLRFDARPGMELVLGLEDGIEIHALDPSSMSRAALHSLRGGRSELSMVETIEGHHSAHLDGIAWAYRVSDQNRWAIAVLSAQGMQAATLLPEGAAIAHMQQGRLDGRFGGGTDLALTLEQSGVVHVLRNLGYAEGSSAFSWELERSEIQANGTHSTTLGQPLLVDLDGDLLAELLVGHAADLEIHYGVGPQPGSLHSSTSELGWAWPVEIDSWLFADDSSNLPAPDYSAIYSSIYSTEDIDTSGSTQPAHAMTASVWVSVSSPGPTPEPFTPLAIGHCDQVSSALVDSATGLHSIALPVHSLPMFDPQVPGDLLGGQRFFALLVHPSTPFPSGAQPGVLMALGALPDTPASAGQLFNHPFLVFRQGLAESDVARMQRQDESGSFGVGIIVETVPIKRMKTPPGFPPRRPTPDCPDVGDGPGTSGS